MVNALELCCNMKILLKKSISIVKDPNGNNIVMINAALFKGKSKVDWDEVERYVRKYVYEFYKDKSLK